jgi:hypothetical protein
MYCASCIKNACPSILPWSHSSEGHEKSIALLSLITSVKGRKKEMTVFA